MAVTDTRTETNGACRMRIQHDVVDSVETCEKGGSGKEGVGGGEGETGENEKERERGSARARAMFC